MDDLAIQFTNVSYDYASEKKALKNIDLKIPRGKKVALIGHNGAGKTTLLLHMNGVLRANEGYLTIAGKRLSYDKASIKEVRKMVGIVFQDPENQLFASDVFNDISFGLKNLDCDEEAVQKKVLEIMEQLNITNFRNQPIHYLSLGQKKKVALAGVLVMEPEIIILDEPTAYLDPKGVKDFIQCMDSLASQNRTIILSTHDLDLAYSWADYTIVMKEGEIISFGKTAEIFLNDQLLASVSLEQPQIISMYKELVKARLISPEDDQHPLTIEELVKNLKNQTTIKEDLVQK